jgi:hypothetical protein
MRATRSPPDNGADDTAPLRGAQVRPRNIERADGGYAARRGPQKEPWLTTKAAGPRKESRMLPGFFLSF